MNNLWEVPPLQVTHLREIVSELGMRRVYLCIPAGGVRVPKETAGTRAKARVMRALDRFRRK